MKRYKIKEYKEYNYFVIKEKTLFMWLALTDCKHFEPKAELQIFTPIKFASYDKARTEIHHIEKARKNHRLYSIDGKLYMPRYYK